MNSQNLIRISLGTILLAHGLLKVMVFTIAGTVGYFASLGIPAVAAYLVIVGELALGIALIIGLQTRLAAALSLPILLGAFYVHLANGWVFSNQGGGWEFPLLLVVLAISVALQKTDSLAVGSIELIDNLLPAALKTTTVS